MRLGRCVQHRPRHVRVGSNGQEQPTQPSQDHDQQLHGRVLARLGDLGVQREVPRGTPTRACPARSAAARSRTRSRRRSRPPGGVLGRRRLDHRAQLEYLADGHLPVQQVRHRRLAHGRHRGRGDHEPAAGTPPGDDHTTVFHESHRLAVHGTADAVAAGQVALSAEYRADRPARGADVGHDPVCHRRGSLVRHGWHSPRAASPTREQDTVLERPTDETVIAHHCPAAGIRCTLLSKPRRGGAPDQRDMTRGERDGRTAGTASAVVDCTRGTAGPRLTQLFADYGAEVVWIEPPGGDPYRAHELAVEYSVFNRGKRSVVLDLRDPAEPSELRAARRVGGRVRPELAPGRGRASRPRLRRAAGRYARLGVLLDLGVRDRRARAATFPATRRSSMPSSARWPSRSGTATAPIFEGLPFASDRRRLPRGGRRRSALCTAGTSTASVATSRPRCSTVRSAYLSMLWGERRRGAPAPTCLGARADRAPVSGFQCADGEYIGVHTGAVGAFGRLMKVLGLDDRIPPSETGHRHRRPAHAGAGDDPQRRAPRALPPPPRAEWVRRLLEADVCAVEHLRPGAGLRRAPAAAQRDGARARRSRARPCPAGGAGGRVRRRHRTVRPSPAPTAGQHTDEVLAESLGPIDAPAARRASRRRGRCWTAFKSLDLGAYYAGPYSSRLLADLGADVVKLEPLMGDQLRGLTGRSARPRPASDRSAPNLKDAGLAEAVAR